jgi:GAF domain-containing protein
VDLAGLQDDSHLLNAPISIRGQLLGRLIFRRDAELPAWTDAERHLLSESAAQIALALENARLVEGAQRRSSQLQFLHELASTTIAHNNLDGLVEDVSERIRVRFNFQRCGVVVFDLARGSATFAADACQASAAGVSAVGARVPMDIYELAREMVNSQRPLVISDAQHDPRSAVMHEFMRQRGTNTWVVAPLVSRGGVLGLIGLEDPDSQRGFEADELLFLEQVSNQVASALDVMTMVDRTRLQARYEHQQAEIVSKMRRTTDMEMILKTAIQELAETLNATRGSIQLGGNHGD